MLVRSFRLPAADTHTPSEHLLNQTRTVFDHAEEGKNAQVSTEQLRAVHVPLNELKQRLSAVQMHIDEIGVNDGEKPDHVLLGYETAKKAAERRPDGSNRLEEFALANRHASLNRNIHALHFLDEHGIQPGAHAASAEILKTLKRLELALEPMPAKEITDHVVVVKNAMDEAVEALATSRTNYQKVRLEHSHDAPHVKNAFREVSTKRIAMQRAQGEYRKLVARPEVGEARATEIVAAFPIQETRKLLELVVDLRAQVLRKRALPLFFDAVHVEQISGQSGARNERERLVEEALQQRGMTPLQIQGELNILRHQEIHGQHHERLRDHVASTSDMATDALTNSTQEQLADLNASLSRKGEDIANQLLLGVNQHTSETAMQTVRLVNNHTDVRMRAVVQTMIDQTNELGRFIREIHHETARRQAQVMHAMIQDAVQAIGQNTERSLVSVKNQMGQILDKNNELVESQQKLLTGSRVESSDEKRSRMIKDTSNVLKAVSYTGKIIRILIGLPW